MPVDLLRLVESTTVDSKTIKHQTQAIHAEVLEKSPYLNEADFTCVHPDDLELLFDEYDRRFFDRSMRVHLGTRRLTFSLSKRMTRTGGMTITTRPLHGEPEHEIRISLAILFGCFRDSDHRSVSVGGIACHDRLEAMQRIMEHEIVHLIETQLWDKSNCARPRFQSIIRRFFGHTEHKHKLITPGERARAQFGIVPGITVRFRFDGVEMTGIVNRVTKRATVLVEDPDGRPYSDGKRYSGYYIPVQQLSVVGPDSGMRK